MELILLSLALILGVSFGSFLNVVIHRVPMKQSIVFPASHCPGCQKQIKSYDNIPILSYIFLQGRFRFCKVHIPIRYLIVEILTGAAFLVLLLVNDFVLDFVLLKNLIFFTCGIAIIFIDFKHYIIPDAISLPLIVLGILFSFLIPTPEWGTLSNWQSSVFGATLGFVIFFAIAYFYQRIKKSDGLGGGDIKYITAVGAFVGMSGLFFVLFFSSLFALFAYFFSILQNLKKVTTQPQPDEDKPQKALAYGPFITLAAFLYILAGDNLIDWYLGFFYI